LGIGFTKRKKDEHQHMFVLVQNVWWIQLVSLTLLCQSFPWPEWAQSISCSAIIIIWNRQCEPATWKSLMSEDQHGRDIAPVLVSQLLHVGGDGCSGNWNLRVFSFFFGSLIHSTSVFSSDLRLNRILKLRTTFFWPLTWVYQYKIGSLILLAIRESYTEEVALMHFQGTQF
jgi:hypothetical protein